MSGSRGRREERAGKSGLEFRVSALGFKDDDGGPPTKPGKSERQRDRETEAQRDRETKKQRNRRNRP